MSVSEIPIRLSESRMFAFFELRMAMMLSKEKVLDCVMSLCTPPRLDMLWVVMQFVCLYSDGQVVKDWCR